MKSMRKSLAGFLAMLMTLLVPAMALAGNLTGGEVNGGAVTAGGSASVTVPYVVSAAVGDGRSFTVPTTLVYSGGSSWSTSGSQTIAVASQGGNDTRTYSVSFSVQVAAGASGTSTFHIPQTCSNATNGANLSCNTQGRVTISVAAPTDTTPPVVTVPGGMTLEATSAAGAAASFTVTANDAVDGPVAVTCSPASGSTFPIGTTTVYCSARDAAGNTGTGSFTVTVRDTTAPSITVPSTISSVEATGSAGAVVSYSVSANDIVDGAVSVSCSPLSGSTFPVGTTTVNCSATDSRGNSAQKSFQISVMDTLAPVLSLPASFAVEASSAAGAVVTYSASATDVVSGNVAVSCSVASGSTLGLGAHTVSCSASDAAGNTATGSFTVTVQDTAPPVLNLPANIATAAVNASGAAVTYSVSASDTVSGSVAVSCSAPSGGTFALGTTTVNCEATDAAGNKTTGSFTVTVSDQTAPVLNLPADITVEATGADGAAVNFTATAVDNVDGTIAATCSADSGSTFAMGSVAVTCSATDAAGNSVSGSFQVTVQDTTAPAIVIPGSFTAAAEDATGAVINFTATASDTVDGNVAVTCSIASGTRLGLGSHPITCEATDAAGNSTSGIFTITVADLTAPVLTLPSAITVEATSAAGAAVEFAASALDNVDGAVAVTCVAAPGSTFTLGTSTVNCSAADAAGNLAEGSFTVTVVDTTAPVLTLPANFTVAAADAGGAVVSFEATALDLVNGAVTVTCSAASGDKLGLGANTVNCSATDAAGNTASGSFVVTVADQTAPALTLPTAITAEATGAAGAAVEFTVSALDNVDGVVAVTCSALSGDTFALGTTTVSCSATDATGNVANGSFEVTVADTTAPELTLPADFTVAAVDAAGAVATFEVSAADIVDGNVTVTCTPASGSLLGLGENVIECSATDAAGNTATGAFVVTVADQAAPVLTLPADITVEATSHAGAVVTFSATALDNVDGVIAVTCIGASGNTFSLGVHTVNCSATDAAGNVATGSFTVTVVDTTKPVVTIGGVVNGGLFFRTAPAVTVTAVDIADANPAKGHTVVENGNGTFTVNAWATDASGNTATTSVTYSVWNFGVSSMPSRANAKLGSTVPVRYTLNLPAGQDPNSMTFRGCINFAEAGKAAPTEGAAENLSTNADTGCTFRYDASAGQYVFNLSTRSMKVGTAYDLYVFFGSERILLGSINVQK